MKKTREVDRGNDELQSEEGKYMEVNIERGRIDWAQEIEEKKRLI